MKFKLILIFLFLLILSSLSLLLVKQSPESTFSKVDSLSKSLDKELAKCVADGDQRRCFTNYFSMNLEKRDSKFLVNQIFLYRKEVPTATQYCHDQALSIGYKAWKEYRDIEKILAFGTPVCASGFLHGVQEAVGKDDAISPLKMIEMVSKVCEVITDNDFRNSNYRVCYHGIGHAVYQKEKDFNPGINICMSLSDKVDDTTKFDQSYTKRELCAEGFSMRFFEPMQPKVDEITYLPKGKPTDVYENPYIFCEKITDKSIRYGCFEYGTRAFGHTQLDYNREAHLCNLYPPIDSLPCYFGISRELAYTAETDTYKNVVEICSQAEDFYSGFICGTNAILNRVTINNNTEEPIIICNKLPKTKLYNEICSYVKEHLTLTTSENSRNI